jgi:tRNA pseudouridine38-40 synthase
MIIEYDGTSFFGWQYQPDRRTVQGEIQTALRQITGEEINLTAAGRTDQGVHALGQVANFHTGSELTLSVIQRAVNALVSDDVHVREITVVPDEFNSRFWAKAKVYHYNITLEPSPFRLRYYWYLAHAPDITIMQSVASSLAGERDFKNFSVHNGENNTVCNVHTITLQREDNRIVMKLEGNRFLRKMVRGIVGFLVDVGRGRFPVPDSRDYFTGIRKDFTFAPPQGLFLVEVKF